MKKKLVLFTLIPLLLLGPVSCNQNNESGKVFLEYGKIYESKPERVQSIDYDTLTSQITGNKKTVFALALSNSGCTCWTTFEGVLASFNYKYNLDIRHIDVSELNKEGRDKFNLYTVAIDTPSIAFFSNGKLIRQAIYGNKATKAIFTDTTGKELEDFFFQNAYLPKMYYASETVINSYIDSNKEFNLYVARSACGDCNTVNTTILKAWNTTINVAVDNPLYILDIQNYHPGAKPVQEEGESDEHFEERMSVYNSKNYIYQRIKVKYGLCEEENADFGYGTGAVPTFQHRTGSKVNDMCVVLNDSVNKTTKVVTSYFTNARVSKMKYLEGTNGKYVLNGIILNNDEASRWGYPDNSAQVERHRPILNLFLKTYVK